jgi:hypothetical protein
MTTQERFAADWGMPLSDVQKLVRLALYAGRCSEKACNGDPHPLGRETDDKAKHAALWNVDGDTIDARILQLIAPYGFTGVEYTGLGPTLRRGGQFVEVPY